MIYILKKKENVTLTGSIFLRLFLSCHWLWLGNYDSTGRCIYSSTHVAASGKVALNFHGDSSIMMCET